MNKKLFLGLLAAAMIFIIGCETTGQGPGGIAFKKPGTTSPTSCPKDLRQCADGSFVARNYDKKCEFFPCPSASDTTTQRFHPSDTNEDWRINLAEMTRFASLAVKTRDIYQGWQFYTWDSEARDGIGDWVGTVGYKVPIDNRYRDGFHPADINKDWRLELGETTGFITLVLKTKELWLGGENYKWDSSAQTWVNAE